MWRNIDKSRANSVHYSIMAAMDGVDDLDALKAMFPDGKANDLNFVLFSTSGVHGTYTTIEEIEADSKKPDDDEDKSTMLTYVIVHPRLVALRYGNCTPTTPEDFAFLKKLRQSSYEVMVTIGAPT